MYLLQILAIVILAALVGILFYYIFRTAGPWGKFWSFILILILAGITAVTWIPPAGPVYLGIHWLPPFFVILVIAILLAAATPQRMKNKEPSEELIEPRKFSTEAVILNIFFWVLIVILFIAALLGIIFGIA